MPDRACLWTWRRLMERTGLYFCLLPSGGVFRRWTGRVTFGRN